MVSDGLGFFFPVVCSRLYNILYTILEDDLSDSTLTLALAIWDLPRGVA